MQKLTNKQVRLNEETLGNVVNKLRAKHPQQSQADLRAKEGLLNKLQQQTAGDAAVAANQKPCVQVTVSDVYELVGKLDKLKAPGVDLFTAEHLKMFMGTGYFKNGVETHNDPDEKDFVAQYTNILNVMLKGSLPESVAAYFRSNTNNYTFITMDLNKKLKKMK